MGFSYSEWAGTFYPRGLKPGEYLSYYAQHFNSVELDTTFHAVPPVDRVKRWRDVTPEDFRFCVKTPRVVTHDFPLEQGAGAMMHFLEVMRNLQEKLGVVLLQFPPSFTVRELSKLDHFLSEMPADLHFAAEFRHASWQRDQTAQLLQKHQVAWVSADHVGGKAMIRPTTDFLYIRWIGEHNRFAEKNHEQADTTDRLQWWKSNINQSTSGGGIDTVWGFFNNDYAGYSVATCNRFKKIVGVPVSGTVSQSVQGQLF
jgi:uncharacterized protein YecE (DUF72 family)